MRVCDLAFRDMCPCARTWALLLIASPVILLVCSFFFFYCASKMSRLAQYSQSWVGLESCLLLKVIFSVHVDGESSCSTVLTRNRKKLALIRFIVTFFRVPIHCRNRMRRRHWSSWRPGDWEEPDVVNNQNQKSTNEEIFQFKWHC